MPNQEPLVSVILPTFNRAEILKKSINSVLSQTYKNFELIIIDDSSTDETERTILEYQKKDSRIKIIRNEKNIGFVKSLNKAIKQSQGKYIARLDDDDFWSSSQKLEKQIGFLENNPDYVLISAGIIYINKYGEEVKRYLPPENDKDIRKLMLITSPLVHIASVFTKKSWETVHGYDEEFYFSQDWDLWAKLGSVGKMYNIQEYLTYSLASNQNRSNKKMSYHLWLNLKIRMKYRKNYPYFWQGYIMGLVAYGLSFLPFYNKIAPILSKLRKHIIKF